LQTPIIQPTEMRVEAERWALAAPFRTAAHTLESIDVVVVTLEKDGHVGRGEAAGVYYRNDQVSTMLDELQSLRSQVEVGLSRHMLQGMLPPGGARNALDCALWDLEARLSGRTAWQIAELERPHPLLTTFTCSADKPARMADAARAYTHARAIKLKLTGEPIDAERVQAVRGARNDAWLAVDANQGFTCEFLEQLLPVLTQARVALIEQPSPSAKRRYWTDLSLRSR
jgi:L-Ala-D/L-Glu epimerase